MWSAKSLRAEGLAADGAKISILLREFVPAGVANRNAGEPRKRVAAKPARGGK